jgi:hypothetical protein
MPDDLFTLAADAQAAADNLTPFEEDADARRRARDAIHELERSVAKLRAAGAALRGESTPAP